MTVEQLIEKLREFPAYREVRSGSSPVISVVEREDARTVFVVVR